MQAEIVQIIKREGTSSQNDFNLNNFLNSQTKKQPQPTPETTDGELEVSTGASSGATLPKRVKHRSSTESTINLSGEDKND
jgi:hypothetical protein